MHSIKLPEDYALVMQQISDEGDEDFNNLAESLKFDRGRLFHIVKSLQHKGLIRLQGDAQRGFWIRLSHKGQRLMRYLWPESGLRPSY